MNDREFDALLESAAPELPPDDVARDVTPWRRAIGNILGGSAMCSITLNFFCLNYLLPTIGVILQLLGFRPLRRENGWFRACWLLAVLRAALFLPCIVLNATIYSNAVYASSVGTALTYAMLAVQMLLFFCFWQAIRAMSWRNRIIEKLCLEGLVCLNKAAAPASTAQQYTLRKEPDAGDLLRCR